MIRQEQTVEATTEVTIKPALQRKLRAELALYTELKTQVDELKAALEASKDSIEGLREAVGAKSFLFDDAKITRVDGGTTRSLDKKKLYAKGITPKQLDDCYVEKPKKGHTLVTLPGGKEDSDD